MTPQNFMSSVIDYMTIMIYIVCHDYGTAQLYPRFRNAAEVSR